MSAQDSVKNLKIFSKKLNSFIDVFPTQENLIPVLANSSWLDKGWNNTSSWMDRGWNNTTSWMDRGWNNTTSWMDRGWNNTSSWSDTGWNNSGNGGGCYITTAAVDHLGMADDCDELNLLRMYRDKLVEEDPEFRKVVLEYYKTAPQIVEKITNSEDKDIVLDNIFKEMVLPVLDLLKNGKTEEAKNLYISIYNDLKEKYILEPQQQLVKKL